ncbi:phosphatidylglycerol lysyltransferase domain-containing protein, partial [Planktotalea sp.]|uniref:phosphatidylglycerol lysyltransferase domain-containing protein n=1 Tax=Planktotalea sp. TaxID=2029877 RepID=UPI0032975BD1
MTSSLKSLSMRRKAGFQLLTLCVVLPVCALAARPFLDTHDWGQVHLAWNGISLQQWVLAGLATTASFASLGRYDVIIHRVLGTGVSTRSAQASGAAAVALSQTLGFGLITGTLARWRGLSQQSIIAAASVTTLVAISFLAAWLMIFAIAGLLAPDALPLPPLFFQACLFSAICLILYTVVKRYLGFAGRRLRLPSLRAISALILYTALDTGFAAFALWILLPTNLPVDFTVLFPIYLACLGIALLSNTPGGLGPFELTLFWALQTQNMNDILASLIAFRIIYFALPAILAMLYLYRPFADLRSRSPFMSRARGLHPETAAGLQTGTPFISKNGAMIGAIARTTQTSTVLFDPAIETRASLDELTKVASLSATHPIYYKCSARHAAILRKQGYATARIAQDAIVELDQFTLDTPSRRGLRRKLRTVEKKGIRIAPFELTPDNVSAAAEIDAKWQAANGSARGFSMGRFEPLYLRRQALFAAWKDESLVAFISCHQSNDTWVLDVL